MKQKYSIYIFLMILCLSLPFISCKSSQGSQDVFNVVTTTGMIKDAALHIGGEKAVVRSLMGPGVDPHQYKASAGDVSILMEADLILYNGLHLEAKMGELFGRLKQKKSRAVAESIPHELLLQAEEGFGAQYDPHVWFDVELWMEVTREVTRAMIEADEANREYYEANRDIYLEKLHELNRYVQEKSAMVPEDKRVLITAHDAFKYFGKAYGFKVMGLQGISTAGEAGTKDVQDLAKFIAENKIPVIFIESSVPIRNIEALQKAVISRGYEVKIGGELFSDAMGEEGTKEGTYIGMVKHNIDTITGAFDKN